MDIDKTEFLRVREVAEILGVSQSAVYVLIHKGEIPHVRFTSKNLRISKRALRDFMGLNV